MQRQEEALAILCALSIVPYHAPYRLLGFAFNPARSCQTREFGNAKRLGGQSKACSEAPLSLKRPGTQGSHPSRKPLRAFMRHPHTILVHQDTPGALSHHHLTRNPSYSTGPSSRSCRRASVSPCAGASYRGGLQFRIIRDLQGRVRKNPVVPGIHQPTRFAYGAISPDRHDLSTLSSRQGLS